MSNSVEVQSTGQVLVQEVAEHVIELTAPAAPVTVEVVTAGPQGAKGADASAYVHQQPGASATWTINHNLGYRPSVELLNTGSQEIEGDVVHTSVNQTVVTFTSAVAGQARLV